MSILGEQTFDFANKFLANHKCTYDRSVFTINDGYSIMYFVNCNVTENPQIHIKIEAEANILAINSLVGFSSCVSVDFQGENIFDFSMDFENYVDYIFKAQKYTDFENLTRHQLKAIGYSQIMISNLFENAQQVFKQLDEEKRICSIK